MIKANLLCVVEDARKIKLSLSPAASHGSLPLVAGPEQLADVLTWWS